MLMLRQVGMQRPAKKKTQHVRPPGASPINIEVGGAGAKIDKNMPKTFLSFFLQTPVVAGGVLFDFNSDWDSRSSRI